METISRRGRHRQDDHDPGYAEEPYDGIPTPRTDFPTTLLRGPIEPGAAPVPEPPDRDHPAADTGWDDWDDAWDGSDPGGWDTEERAALPAATERDPGWDAAGWDDARPDDTGDRVWEDRRRIADEPELAARTAAPLRTAAPAYAGPKTRRRRRAARPAGRVLRRVAWVAAGIAALVGIALAAVVAFPNLTRGPGAAPVPVAAPAPVPVESTFGQRAERADGWAVEIDEPTVARSALPIGADRGVVLDVVLINTSADPRDTAGWTVKAVVGSSPVEIRPASVPSRTVRPGASLTFPVTVPMPEDTADLQLEAAPAGGVPTLFVGAA